VVRQWKDRLKKVEVPLFSSYVFVKVNAKQYYEIPKLIKGFVKYVTIGGNIIEVRETEIELIRRIVDNAEFELEVNNENFSLNELVEVKIGQFKGVRGRLVEFRGKYKMALRIETLGANLMLEINKNAVKKAV
jgi:transcription antitermination factor NusG